MPGKGLWLSLIACIGVGGALLWSPEPAVSVSPPTLTTEGGVVATDNATASYVGAEILASGGTAADAAVGVAAVLGVTQPFASGLGGGGFCVYYDKSDDVVVALDFRETTPAAGTVDMFLDAEGNAQPELSRFGGMAVGVPGEVAGLARLHERFGTRPWRNNFAGAIALARHGYPAGLLLTQRVEKYKDKIEALPGLAAWLMPNGQIPAPGERLENTALADTLSAIAQDGPLAFYEGSLATGLAAEVAAQGGLLTAADMAAYTVKEREPIVGEYRGYAVYSMPPPSSGGIAVVQTLNLLAGFEVADMGLGSSRYLHHLAESMKFAFADRAEFLGDPDFVDVPIAQLTSTAYAETLRAQINPDSVLPLEAYGPARYTPDDGGTSHFSIIDREGNAAACTSTVNTSFGSFVYVDALGVVLNNQLDDFVQKPGEPNTYGLVGSAANAPAALKRPLSSMSPTLLMHEGDVIMAVGASGGPTIISGVIQTIVHIVDFGLTAREAVEAPRIHHQWRPNKLFVEPETVQDVVDNLTLLGQTVVVRPAFSAVQVATSDGKRRTAASDPRKQGQPAAEPGFATTPLPAAVQP